MRGAMSIVQAAIRKMENCNCGETSQTGNNAKVTARPVMIASAHNGIPTTRIVGRGVRGALKRAHPGTGQKASNLAAKTI